MNLENVIDKINSNLHTCSFKVTRTREQAEQAILLFEKYKPDYTGIHYSHGLVYFPDLLKRYLDVFNGKVRVHDIDLSCMIARCIEHSEIDINSLHHLIAYLNGNSLELKLLRGKYNINTERYNLCKSHCIRDRFYDGVNTDYFYDDINTKDNKGLYTGYRDSYHCLLYGNKRHLEILLKIWKSMQDCTYEAALDFFGVKEYDEIIYKMKEIISNRL